MATNKASPSRPSAAEIREEIRFWQKKLYEIEGGQGSAGDQGSVGNQGSVGSVGGHGSVGSVGGSAGWIDVEEEEWRLEEADPTAPFDEATIKFPSNIRSMDHWGRSLIAHGGTYRNRSYVDMATSTVPLEVRYRKWIKDFPTDNPCIIDFVAYLRYYELLHPKVVVTFPGSKIIRRFAPAATKGEQCTRS